MKTSAKKSPRSPKPAAADLRRSPARATKTARSRAASQPLYVLSDSTGNLARHMLSAFQTQFPPDSLQIQVEPFVRTLPRLREILQRARRQNAAVCHAMVSQSFKRQVEKFCKTNHLLCRDLTGEVVAFMSAVAGRKPRPDIPSLHRIDEAYRRRISALEYTITHDDGLGLDSLAQADAILVGVSRTSKTPTSIYLAQMGYRIANVSLALGIDPPEQLLALPPEKVIGLCIDPEQLIMIRQRRQATFGVNGMDYGQSDHVQREIAWTRRLFASRNWKTLDVTDQAIEETAARILEHLAPDSAAADSELQ